MNVIERIEQYKTFFERDPLLRRIRNERLEEQLFNANDFFEKVSFTDTYSSKNAAEILGIPGKEQILLNYNNRHDLNLYLNVFKQKRFYRYEWKSLFKFKMILLLSENNFTPLEIASLVGTSPEIEQVDQVSDNHHKNEFNEQITEKRIHEIADVKIQNLYENISKYDNYKNAKWMLELKHQTLILEQKMVASKVEGIEKQLEDIEEFEDVINSNKNEQETVETKSFFDKIFKRKDTSNNNMLVYNQMLSKQIRKKEGLLISKNDLESETKRLMQEIEDTQQSIKKLNVEMQQEKYLTVADNTLEEIKDE